MASMKTPDHLVNGKVSGFAYMVLHRSDRHIPNMPPLLMRPPADVNIFAIHKEALIKALQLIPTVTANYHGAARHPIHILNTVVAKIQH